MNHHPSQGHRISQALRTPAFITSEASLLPSQTVTSKITSTIVFPKIFFACFWVLYKWSHINIFHVWLILFNIISVRFILLYVVEFAFFPFAVRYSIVYWLFIAVNLSVYYGWAWSWFLVWAVTNNARYELSFIVFLFSTNICIPARYILGCGLWWSSIMCMLAFWRVSHNFLKWLHQFVLYSYSNFFFHALFFHLQKALLWLLLLLLLLKEKWFKSGEWKL